jgi:hypothetical protein
LRVFRAGFLRAAGLRFAVFLAAGLRRLAGFLDVGVRRRACFFGVRRTGFLRATRLLAGRLRAGVFALALSDFDPFFDAR